MLHHSEVDSRPVLVPPPPVHPLSSVVTIVLDQIWGVLEVGATISIAALPLLLPLVATCGALGFASVTLIQRYLSRDPWGASIAKGLAMGIVAAVPYAVTGTAAGGGLLLWAGARQLESIVRKRLPPAPR